MKKWIWDSGEKEEKESKGNNKNGERTRGRWTRITKGIRLTLLTCWIPVLGFDALRYVSVSFVPFLFLPPLNFSCEVYRRRGRVDRPQSNPTKF